MSDGPAASSGRATASAPVGGLRRTPPPGTVARRLIFGAAAAALAVLPAVALGAPAAQASQTDCLSYAYACTPGYDGVNTEGTWAWAHYGGSYALNANGYHNCTLYAAWRLEQNGMPDPGNWGNAVDWINHTSYNHTPAVGSIAWWNSGQFGHVAYVDQVNGGQVHVVADNYAGPNADGYTDSGWIAASSVDEFLHPHDNAPLSVVGPSLAPGTVGSPYSATLTASGGTPPYSWSVSAGALPPGLALSAGGSITGTPVGEGTFSFTVTVADSAGHSASAAASQYVAGAQLLVIRQGTAALQGKTGLNDHWTALASNLPGKIAVAGNRIAVLTPSHVLWAKDGLNGTWYKEAGNVTSFALGPQLVVVRESTGPDVYGKTGLNDPWTVLTSLPGKIAVSGNRIAVLTPSHVLWTKDGLNGTWYKEAGNVTSFAADG